jgi:hypothetical protein
MQKDSKYYVIGGIIFALIIISIVVFVAKKSDSGPGKLDAFATCLKDEGAVFYGAFWCSHCQATKRLFGSSASKLPYVECSTPSGNGQLPICAEKKVENYPTWIFKDGSRLTGELSLQTLSEKTSCTIYPDTAASTSTLSVVATSSSASGVSSVSLKTAATSSTIKIK